MPLDDVQLSVTLLGAVLTLVGKIWEGELQKRYLLWKLCSVFLEQPMPGDPIQLDRKAQTQELGGLSSFFRSDL